MPSKYRQSAMPSGGSYIIAIIVFILLAALASLCVALLSEKPGRVRGATAWFVLAAVLCSLLWTRQNWARQLFAGVMWIGGSLIVALLGIGLIMSWQESGDWSLQDVAAVAVVGGTGIACLIVASLLTTNKQVQAFFQGTELAEAAEQQTQDAEPR